MEAIVKEIEVAPATVHACRQIRAHVDAALAADADVLAQAKVLRKLMILDHNAAGSSLLDVSDKVAVRWCLIGEMQRVNAAIAAADPGRPPESAEPQRDRFVEIDPRKGPSAWARMEARAAEWNYKTLVVAAQCLLVGLVLLMASDAGLLFQAIAALCCCLCVAVAVFELRRRRKEV